MDNLTYQNSTQHALITSFAWMLVGLVVTGITSLFFLSSGAFYMMLYRVPFLFIGIMIAQIAVVIAFTSAMRRSSANVMKILFMVYAVTLGITMTSIAFTYSLGTISLAFFVSAIYFLTLIVIGVTTKRDLSGMGTICLGALIALIVTQIILMILHIPMYSRVMCFLGLLIFTGCLLLFSEYYSKKIVEINKFYNANILNYFNYKIFKTAKNTTKT